MTFIPYVNCKFISRVSKMSKTENSRGSTTEVVTFKASLSLS